MKDKYDEAVEWLTRHPKQIKQKWLNGYWRKSGPSILFARTGPVPCGCLTTVKEGKEIAETFAITQAIRKDRRLPKKADKITVKHLPVFAEWQRRLDRELQSRRAKA